MRAVTPILLLVIVILMSSFPSVITQSVTTVTNVMTTTGFSTSTAYSTQEISTMTRTVMVSSTFVSTTDTNQKPANHPGCYYDYWNITVDPGTIEITGTIGPPSAEINFYIMTPGQYMTFRRGQCGATYVGVVTVYRLTKAYSLDWKNPSPGWYYFIFHSDNTLPGGYTITTPFVLVATLNQAETSTKYQIATNVHTMQVSQTITSVQVSEISTNVGITFDPTLIAAGIIVVVAILGTLFFVRTRQGKAKGKPSRNKESNFCINCGGELPAGSKFCNKCGSSQG